MLWKILPREHMAQALAAAFVLVLFSTAGAAPIESLLMPGDVITGHAKYEKECKKCHRPFSKATQAELCTDCHKKVGEDVKGKKGFHGKNADAGTWECKRCHTDHKGRDFDIIRMDRELFDHGETDFRLEGKHALTECTKCHVKDKLYREAPGICYDCHKDDGPHKGRLGKKCEKCHDAKSWKATDFDHAKTDFPLKGAHKKTSCNKCHPGELYKDIATDCYSCHKLSDVHGGRYGSKCKDCHSPEKWTKTVFDHDKTKFKLKWKHESVGCDKCHADKGFKKKVPSDCFSCHKNNDEHKGRYGKKCEECHSERSWTKTAFDHGKTKFKLKAKHEKVECKKCHITPVHEKKTPVKCIGCHGYDDVHKGQEGKLCDKCHSENGWRVKVSFDHDLRDFPLIGLHAIAPCEECHVTAAYKDASAECLKCHKSEDEHKAALGAECGACHNPNGWKLWRFDHDSDTDFKLDGKHEGLKCSACHTQPVKKEVKLSSSCYGCHREEDAHRGRFGMSCDRCHDTESFFDVNIM